MEMTSELILSIKDTIIMVSIPTLCAVLIVIHIVSLLYLNLRVYIK